jgi:hypothetical protein
MKYWFNDESSFLYVWIILKNDLSRCPAWQCVNLHPMLPPDHLFLDRSPNTGPLISHWELDKFKICWNKSFRTSKILTLLYQQFSNLLISQRDMSGPRLGALSNYRWSGGNMLIARRVDVFFCTTMSYPICHIVLDVWLNKQWEMNRQLEELMSWMTRNVSKQRPRSHIVLCESSKTIMIPSSYFRSSISQLTSTPGYYLFVFIHVTTLLFQSNKFWLNLSAYIDKFK